MRAVSVAKANKIRNILSDKILVDIEKKIVTARTITFVGYENQSEVTDKVNIAVADVNALLASRLSVVDVILA